MLKISNKLFVIACLLTASLQVNNAVAEKGGKGHDKGNKHHEEHNDHHDGGRGDNDERYYKRFGNSDRVVITRYLTESYHSGCPRGLAKKHNGCRPPGHDKHYHVGHRYEGEWEPLPESIIYQLRPAPHGHRYVKVDEDVLLMAEGSKMVIDAITLFSAVGN